MARINKTIEPGFIEAKINLLTLDKPPFKSVVEGEVYLVLHLETTKPEEGFIGFDRVYGKPELGKAEGQVGRIKANRFTFKDGELDGGRKLNRDQDISTFMEALCTELGIIGWLKEAKTKCAVVDELVDMFNEERPFEDRYLHWNVGSRVYKNKAGYDAHDLHLNYADKGYKQFSSKEWEVDPSARSKSEKPKPPSETKTATTTTKASTTTATPTPSTKRNVSSTRKQQPAMSPNESFLSGDTPVVNEPIMSNVDKNEDDPDELPFKLSNQAESPKKSSVVVNASNNNNNNKAVSPDIFTSEDMDEPPF